MENRSWTQNLEHSQHTHTLKNEAERHDAEDDNDDEKINIEMETLKTEQKHE